MGNNYSKEFTETIHISDLLERERTYEFYKKNKKLFLIVLVLSFGAPIFGYFITGVIGVIFGLTISVLLYFLSPYTTTKIREITQYKAE